MKTDRITKLYEDLTNKERAALCYRYQMDDNDVEVARIIATVPRKAYEGADEEFKGWLISFSVMANVWAINHWKLYSRHLAATGGFVYHAGRNEFDQAWVWDQAFTYWETHYSHWIARLKPSAKDTASTSTAPGSSRERPHLFRCAPKLHRMRSSKPKWKRNSPRFSTASATEHRAGHHAGGATPIRAVVDARLAEYEGAAGIERMVLLEVATKAVLVGIREALDGRSPPELPISKAEKT